MHACWQQDTEKVYGNTGSSDGASGQTSFCSFLIMEAIEVSTVKQAIEVSTSALLRNAPAIGNCTSARPRQQLDCTQRTNITQQIYRQAMTGTSVSGPASRSGGC